jgi:ATP-dependent helicase/nuclease subunit B
MGRRIVGCENLRRGFQLTPDTTRTPLPMPTHPSLTWITANQRLASYIQATHNHAQQAAGETAWETPDCLSLKHWILRAYNGLPHSSAYVLTPSQELVLWENIIADALENMPAEWAFLSTRSLAKTAQSAWHLLQESHTPLDLLEGTDSPEINTFYQWANTFAHQLHTKNALDFHSCMQQVIEAIAVKQVLLPERIILVGFEEISPQIETCFKLLATQCVLEHHTHEQDLHKQIQKMGLAHEELELRSMAAWAHHMQRQHPDQRIGCVVPDLHTKRHMVTRIFNEVFGETPYNVSGGFPLPHFPLIQTAFDILHLGASTLDIPLLSRILTSPFIGGAEQECTARAALDIQLRKTQEPSVYWNTLQAMAIQEDGCDMWLAQYAAYKTDHASHISKQTAYAWSQHFAAQLQCMGWPGERTLSSTEYQLAQRWNALLEEFTRLDAMLEKPLSRAKALSHLKHLADDTVFQPQTVKASVQVLGLLEAVGLPFTGLWISGMTQENWPRPAAPNPFIPLALQRARNMPHASAERELAYSQTLTRHFSRSAQTVIFSYPLQKEDSAQTASTLIQDLPEIDVLRHCEERFLRGSNPGENPKTHIPQDALEYISDNSAPPLDLSNMPTDKTLRGGASIFTHQAACPFRAFARLRLETSCMPSAASYITPQEQGTCLHAILEQIWRMLEDHATLCLHDENALEKRIQPMVQDTLQDLAKKRPFSLKPRFLALEEKRLTAQVLAWLSLEKKRPPFRVVGIESEQTVFFAGLPLKLRVDREDVLEDGSHLLIDYKTGKGSPADWTGERPHSPQLPLYGVTATHPIGGLAFAQISAEKLGFSGVSAEESDIAGIDTVQKSLHQSAEAFFAESEKTLTQLALNFQQGDAKVDPKELEKTCRYCDLQSLCRIHQKCTP